MADAPGKGKGVGTGTEGKGSGQGQGTGSDIGAVERKTDARGKHAGRRSRAGSASSASSSSDTAAVLPRGSIVCLYKDVKSIERCCNKYREPGHSGRVLFPAVTRSDVFPETRRVNVSLLCEQSCQAACKAVPDWPTPSPGGKGGRNRKTGARGDNAGRGDARDLFEAWLKAFDEVTESHQLFTKVHQVSVQGLECIHAELPEHGNYLGCEAAIRSWSAWMGIVDGRGEPLNDLLARTAELLEAESFPGSASAKRKKSASAQAGSAVARTAESRDRDAGAHGSGADIDGAGGPVDFELAGLIEDLSEAQAKVNRNSKRRPPTPKGARRSKRNKIARTSNNDGQDPDDVVVQCGEAYFFMSREEAASHDKKLREGWIPGQGVHLNEDFDRSEYLHPITYDPID